MSRKHKDPLSFIFGIFLKRLTNLKKNHMINYLLKNKCRKNSCLFCIIVAFMTFAACSSNKSGEIEMPSNSPDIDTVYDEKGCLYTSYDSLVMAGYQGWFCAEGDGSNRGWYHYQKNGIFKPGFTSIDFWPDVSEYQKIYQTEFFYPDGKPAFVYSAYDEESVDLHFKWMKDYGIDGVFMQRFVTEIKNPSGKAHFNKVLKSALKAANKYKRAICIMYDLSGCTSNDIDFISKDWKDIQNQYDLFNSAKNPTYLRHEKKPLLAIWGVGFNDGRKYTLSDVQELISSLKGSNNKVSIMLGVPYYWRTLNNDTEDNALLHSIIKKCEIIMPWAVGRYNFDTYHQIAGIRLPADLKWCKENHVTYIPLAFPGFSWGNLKNDPLQYNLIPREGGNFFWEQIVGAKNAGAKSLYIAMFDEIDEGTAIYKCLKEDEVPFNASGKFVGIESNLSSDYYLWLTGQATRWFHGKGNYSSKKPERE